MTKSDVNVTFTALDNVTSARLTINEHVVPAMDFKLILSMNLVILRNQKSSFEQEICLTVEETVLIIRCVMPAGY